MGLQFNDNGITRTLTLADMATMDFRDSYSDLYKGLNGFRPRGHSAETMLRFFDTYETELAEHEAEEARELKAQSDHDGVEYTSWSHYYDVKETRDHAQWEAAEAQRVALAAEKAEFVRRGSPMPAIIAWEHGSL